MFQGLRKDRALYKSVFSLAVPMIISNITVPLLGLVDTAVIGHLEHPYYLGGVAEGTAVIIMILWVFSFLRMSTTGLTAQAFGARDFLKMQSLLVQGLFVATVVGIFFIILKKPVAWLAFALTDGSEMVKQYGAIYFNTRIWGAPAALCNVVLSGWLLGMQKPKSTLGIVVFYNGLNIVLDLVFVRVYHFGVFGVAIASVVSSYLAFLLGVSLAYRLMVRQKVAFKLGVVGKAVLEPKGLKHFFLVNRDIFLRSLFLQICFVFMTFEGAKIGDLVVAANAVLMNFLLLASYGLDGLAHAAEALVGRAFGAKDKKQITKIIKVTLICSMAMSVCIGFVFYLFGDLIVGMITDIQTVKKEALLYLPWLVAMPVVGVFCYLFDGVFIGATKAKEMRNSMIFSVMLVFFPTYYLAYSYKNHGLWLAMTALMASRGITLGWILLKQFRQQRFII